MFNLFSDAENQVALYAEWPSVSATWTKTHDKALYLKPPTSLSVSLFPIFNVTLFSRHHMTCKHNLPQDHPQCNSPNASKIYTCSLLAGVPSPGIEIYIFICEILHDILSPDGEIKASPEVEKWGGAYIWWRLLPFPNLSNFRGFCQPLISEWFTLPPRTFF